MGFPQKGSFFPIMELQNTENHVISRKNPKKGLQIHGISSKRVIFPDSGSPKPRKPSIFPKKGLFDHRRPPNSWDLPKKGRFFRFWSSQTTENHGFHEKNPNSETLNASKGTFYPNSRTSHMDIGSFP
jgi:hypothetical protein